MKLCRTCRFGRMYELDKPCVVYRDDCPLYQKEGDAMNREEAIEELKAIKSAYSNKAFEDSRLMRSEIEALDVAIKALEQEPKTVRGLHLSQQFKDWLFIKGQKTDVLDKIRAEIKALSNANPSYWHSGDMVEREEVFEIINKYRVESEDKE